MQGSPPQMTSVSDLATSALAPRRRRIGPIVARHANRMSGSCNHRSGHAGVDARTAAPDVKRQLPANRRSTAEVAAILLCGADQYVAADNTRPARPIGSLRRRFPSTGHQFARANATADAVSLEVCDAYRNEHRLYERNGRAAERARSWGQRRPVRPSQPPAVERSGRSTAVRAGIARTCGPPGLAAAADGGCFTKPFRLAGLTQFRHGAELH